MNKATKNNGQILNERKSLLKRIAHKLPLVVLTICLILIAGGMLFAYVLVTGVSYYRGTQSIIYNKLYDEDTVWVLEDDSAWFYKGIGQYVYQGEIIDVYYNECDGYTEIMRLERCFEEDGKMSFKNLGRDGIITYFSTDYSRITKKLVAEFKDDTSKEYKEYKAYGIEDFKEAYPQFEFQTLDEYKEENWPERYPAQDVYKLLDEGIWINTAPLIWISDNCGQAEIGGEIINIIILNRLPTFELCEIDSYYAGDREYLFSGEIYYNNISNTLKAKITYERELFLEKESYFEFRRISKEELEEKYPLFEYYTKDSYEKEHKLRKYKVESQEEQEEIKQYTFFNWF